jgi:hypothetical protein
VTADVSCKGRVHEVVCAATGVEILSTGGGDTQSVLISTVNCTDQYRVCTDQYRVCTDQYRVSNTVLISTASVLISTESVLISTQLTSGGGGGGTSSSASVPDPQTGAVASSSGWHMSGSTQTARGGGCGCRSYSCRRRSSSRTRRRFRITRPPPRDAATRRLDERPLGCGLVVPPRAGKRDRILSRRFRRVVNQSSGWSTNLVIGQRESGDSTTTNLHGIHESGDWSSTCLGRGTNHQIRASTCPTNQMIGLSNLVTGENPSKTKGRNGNPFRSLVGESRDSSRPAAPNHQIRCPDT